MQFRTLEDSLSNILKYLNVNLVTSDTDDERRHVICITILKFRNFFREFVVEISLKNIPEEQQHLFNIPDLANFERVSYYSNFSQVRCRLTLRIFAFENFGRPVPLKVTRQKSVAVQQ